MNIDRDRYGNLLNIPLNEDMEYFLDRTNVTTLQDLKDYDLVGIKLNENSFLYGGIDYSFLSEIFMFVDDRFIPTDYINNTPKSTEDLFRVFACRSRCLVLVNDLKDTKYLSFVGNNELEDKWKSIKVIHNFKTPFYLNTLKPVPDYIKLLDFKIKYIDIVRDRILGILKNSKTPIKYDPDKIIEKFDKIKSNLKLEELEPQHS